jgi:predicted ester cyclase
LQENKEIIKSLVDEVFNKHDLSVIDKYHVADLSNDSNILESFKQSLAALYSGFPDLRVSIEYMIAENNIVVAFLSIIGTHTGLYKGLQPTNKQMQIRSADLYKIENGKIAAHRDVVNILDLLTQTGAITYKYTSQYLRMNT